MNNHPNRRIVTRKNVKKIYRSQLPQNRRFAEIVPANISESTRTLNNFVERDKMYLLPHIHIVTMKYAYHGRKIARNSF